MSSRPVRELPFHPLSPLSIILCPLAPFAWHDMTSETRKTTTEKKYVPAPVTSATLPVRLADWRPRGPGIRSYLLSPEGACTVPGILAAGGVLITGGGVELELLEETDTVCCLFFSVLLVLLDEKWDRRRARKAGRAIDEWLEAAKLGGTGLPTDVAKLASIVGMANLGRLTCRNKIS